MAVSRCAQSRRVGAPGAFSHQARAKDQQPQPQQGTAHQAEEGDASVAGCCWRRSTRSHARARLMHPMNTQTTRTPAVPCLPSAECAQALVRQKYWWVMTPSGSSSHRRHARPHGALLALAHPEQRLHATRQWSRPQRFCAVRRDRGHGQTGLLGRLVLSDFVRSVIDDADARGARKGSSLGQETAQLLGLRCGRGARQMLRSWRQGAVSPSHDVLKWLGVVYLAVSWAYRCMLLRPRSKMQAPRPAPRAACAAGRPTSYSPATVASKKA
jgi:hypothetical protein